MNIRGSTVAVKEEVQQGKPVSHLRTLATLTLVSMRKIRLLLLFVLLRDCIADEDEPPVNPFLADSPWPMTHRNPYQQGSSPLPGPDTDKGLRKDLAPPLFSAIAPLYDHDQHVWLRVPFLGVTAVLDNERFHKIRGIHLGEGPSLNAISGAYTLLDVDNTFFHGRETTIQSFVMQDDDSVQRVGEFALPDNIGTLVGLNMLYDGMLVYATSQSVVGVISRDFDTTTAQNLVLSDDESVSNSIAVDETNGIYVVTSQQVYGVQWDGSSLSIAWQASYNAVGRTSTPAGRLGAGSGSTPSLMGTREDDDRFVVITDGAELMNIVLLWRGEIPLDWVPVVPNEPRIAAQVPVTFGNSDATASASEQSVLVRGYGAAVVNNYYGISLPSWVPDIFSPIVILFSNLPFIAPHGVEKFEWDPVARSFDSVWASRSISCPNGIPTMSASSGIMYCVGQRFVSWTLEALSWEDGSSVFRKFIGWWFFFNSAYAAIEVGPDRELLTGGLGGAIRFRAT